jgi:hypothetical protein
MKVPFSLTEDFYKDWPASINGCEWHQLAYNTTEDDVYFGSITSNGDDLVISDKRLEKWWGSRIAAGHYMLCSPSDIVKKRLQKKR